ncbi:MAG TPA: serine/threonine-protein kinase, partial [Haliangium sp.]|nr:serine/threonine-protein kinase [Haliangium sp.]
QPQAATRPAAAVESHTPDGRRLLGGRFALGTRIGGRQTGEVYEAVDQSSGQTCVVKVIDAEVFPSNLVLQRTERELSKLARLDAPGIARILEYGRVDDRLWMACERVPGSRSLLDIVFDEGPMPAQRAAAILLDVGKALAEAAKVGIIHRDLAPKNVLLGADGAIKLINFGVAVPTTGKVQGVPEFVAPEIVEGKPVDQRANIYSLGALFYYMVAGRPPYMGEPEEVYEQHLSAEPEPPSTHMEDVSEAVDAVILRALARSSSRRFMTLRQLLTDVERIAAGEEPATTSSAAGTLMPARGKGKSKKLAQTMVGGFQVAQEAARKQAEAAGAGAVASGAGVVQAGAGAAAGSAGAVTGSAGAVAGSAGAAQAGAVRSMAGTAAGSVPGRAGASTAEAGDIQAAVEVAGMIGGQDSAGEPGRLARDVDADATAAAAAGEAQAAGARVDQVSETAPAAGGQARTGFRETKWFKEGAAASASDDESAGASGSAAVGASVSARAGEAAGKGDREKYSLQTGATEVMASARAPKAAGEDVSSREMISEMKAGRGKILAAIVIAIVLIAVLVVWAVTGG